MSDALRVGLVGAGPWAQMVHAPVLAAGPETVLAGVWARRPEVAAELAAKHGAQQCDSLDALFEICDAVAFCVPPDVQADLATKAAGAGKALLLEKPIAADVAGAERLVKSVDDAGVPSMIVLSWRYADAVREFIAAARAADVWGGRGSFVGGGLIQGPFRTPWRLERGAVLDLGPHILDLLDASIGTITGVEARGDPHRIVSILCEHEGGVTSVASISAFSPVQPARTGAEVWGPDGVIEVDCARSVGREAFATLRDEFAACARGERHELDVHHGLHLQRLIDAAESQLRR